MSISNWEDAKKRSNYHFNNDIIDKNNITLNDKVYDMAVYYSSEVCDQCLQINDEDLLLVTNNNNAHSVDIEIPELFKEIKINSSISDRYEVNIYNGTIAFCSFNIKY